MGGPGRGLALGKVLADRRIDAVAGEGGMGVVYRAWNLRLKRVEAVKVIGEEFVRERLLRDRFQRETEIAANIDHPHVVTVYDSGEGPDGQLFIAMQYVEGTNLDRLIAQRGRLDAALAATLISQVASALDAAHAQGLVHRDVKPANILIAGDEGRHHAFLTDFGLAKQVSSRTGLTGTGLMLGTVDYMAPEQAQGGSVDLRADVYALGATLFKALTGQVPYLREGSVARLVAKLGEPPPMASQVGEGVPATFDAVIARAMSLDPAGRYTSAGELGRASLAAAGSRRPSDVRPPVGPGAVVGECLLEDVIGEGGMAVVYRAKQLKLGRTVAVKVMSDELTGDPAFRARFEREWRVAAAIDHANVVPVYSAGDADGVLYIVMRYVAGGTLRDALLAEGRLEPERAVEVIEQVASALDAAHRRGLVHRDIKPGNVLIDDDRGRVFLTDFGLAKAVDDADITDARAILGTARYIAPERARGSAIDEVRGDIYALGCVLWDLLGGIERLDPATVAGVPAALADVVTRATELEPSARYASADELARAARASLTAAAEASAPRPAGRAGTVTPAVAPSREPVAPGREAFSPRREPVAPHREPFAPRREPFAPKPLSTGLRQRVLTICDSALEVVDDERMREALLAVRDELTAPLRLAVVGGSARDRETLLGALLGRSIGAPGDLDRIATTTSFAHGSPERVEARLLDGGRVEHALAPDGALPREVGAASGRLSSLRFWLPIDRLRTVSLVCPAGGRRGSGAALADLGDALLVTVPAPGDGDTEVTRAAIVDALAGVPSSAVNATCVLATSDLSPGATTDAAAVKRALGPLVVAGVVPFSGVPALAANTGLITEQLVADLTTIAGADPKALLASERALLAASGPLPSERGQELLARIGLPGIRAAVELADVGELTTVGVTRRLRELSGIEEVDREIDGLDQRVDALKAARGLTALEQLSYRWQELAPLRDQVETARFEPRMHVLDLVQAFQRCVQTDIDLPAELLAELERLVTARTPGRRLGVDDGAEEPDLAQAAVDGFRTWKTFENGSQASPSARRVAQVVARSLQLISRESEQPAVPAGSVRLTAR